VRVDGTVYIFLGNPGVEGSTRANQTSATASFFINSTSSPVLILVGYSSSLLLKVSLPSKQAVST
jgi:hypothetical protein